MEVRAKTLNRQHSNININVHCYAIPKTSGHEIPLDWLRSR